MRNHTRSEENAFDVLDLVYRALQLCGWQVPVGDRVLKVILWSVYPSCHSREVYWRAQQVQVPIPLHSQSLQCRC